MKTRNSLVLSTQITELLEEAETVGKALTVIVTEDKLELTQPVKVLVPTTE